MVGIVGRIPFEDRMVTSPGDGPERMKSEYSDVRRPMPEEKVRLHAMERMEAREARETPGMGGRIASFVSRTMNGAAVEDHIRSARLIEHEADAYRRNDQGFASMIARHMVGKPDAEVRRVVPGVREGDLPKQRDLRWLEIAKGGIDIAHDHVERGNDYGLGSELGRRVRLAALGRAANPTSAIDLRRPLPEMLEREAAARASEVRNYMSAGPEVMAAITRQAMAVSRDGHDLSARLGDMQVEAPSDPIQRQEWTRKVLLERHALARAGGVDDETIMKRASNLAAVGGLRGDHSRDGTFIRPSAARSAASIAMQEAMHDRARGVEPMQVGARAAAVYAQAAGRDR